MKITADGDGVKIKDDVKKLAKLLKQLSETEQLAVLDIVNAARVLARKKAATHHPLS